MRIYIRNYDTGGHEGGIVKLFKKMKVSAFIPYGYSKSQTKEISHVFCKEFIKGLRK